MDKVVRLVDGGSVINGAYSVYFVKKVAAERKVSCLPVSSVKCLGCLSNDPNRISACLLLGFEKRQYLRIRSVSFRISVVFSFIKNLSEIILIIPLFSLHCTYTIFI